MNNIKIICETMNDLPDGLEQEYDIQVLPVTIVLDSKEYKAGVDLDTNTFYKKLRESETMPTTSQVTYATFKEVFDKNLEQGYEILYLAGSSAASGTYQSAMIAKNDIESDKIHIFDTSGVSIFGGILIKKAAEMVKEGHSIESIIKELEICRDKVHVYFSVDSLDYLQKGGRISGTKAAIGTLLNIKPILNIENGLVKQKGQVRGSKKIMPSLIDHIKQEVKQDLQDKDIYVGYGDDFELRDKLIEKVKSEINPKNIYTFQIGSCVACHSGPNVLGIACLDR